MKKIFLKYGFKDNKVITVNDETFKEINITTNLTVGYIVKNNYYDGVIIIGKNKNTIENAISEAFKKYEKAVFKMTEKIYFTQIEALETIKETLENGFDGYFEDLHNESFNTDYYIIGTYKAKQALNQYGTFEAMEEIKEYEENNFGEILTDLSDAEKVSNMFWCLIGRQAIELINFEGLENEQGNDENNKIIIKSIENKISELKEI